MLINIIIIMTALDNGNINWCLFKILLIIFLNLHITLQQEKMILVTIPLVSGTVRQYLHQLFGQLTEKLNCVKTYLFYFILMNCLYFIHFDTLLKKQRLKLILISE